MPETQLPRRIILSRKGADASAGGFPSLICDGRLLNIPIPEEEFDHRVTYERLPLPPGPWAAFGNFGNLVDHLSRGRLRADCRVHRDPDIRPELHANGRECRRTLGQCCRPDAELACVEKGDLFLFFGWFVRARITEQTVRRGEEEHTIWGWLQADMPIRLAPHQAPTHPHEYPRLQRFNGRPHAGNRNSLYPALGQLTFRENVAGCGVFSNWREALRLTHPACRQGCRSLWRLPSFLYQQLRGIGPDARWTRDGEFAVVQAVGRHQEYVFQVPEDEAAQQEIEAWLETLPW